MLGGRVGAGVVGLGEGESRAGDGVSEVVSVGYFGLLGFA